METTPAHTTVDFAIKHYVQTAQVAARISVSAFPQPPLATAEVVGQCLEYRLRCFNAVIKHLLASELIQFEVQAKKGVLEAEAAASKAAAALAHLPRSRLRLVREVQDRQMEIETSQRNAAAIMEKHEPGNVN